MTEAPTHPAAVEPEVFLRNCDARYSKAGGPGGQHRNKVETAVTLTHRPTGLSASASERRERAVNQRVALFRLRTRLAIEFRRDLELQAYNPSPLWEQRCGKSGVICINPSHDDMPSLLSEALDVVAGCGYDVKQAAACLATTPSQLVKLFRAVPAALVWLNRQRGESGLAPLK